MILSNSNERMEGGSGFQEQDPGYNKIKLYRGLRNKFQQDSLRLVTMNNPLLSPSKYHRSRMSLTELGTRIFTESVT